jgi:tRNA threonylcarbamoyladenosine biosynthesis protein TsaE
MNQPPSKSAASLDAMHAEVAPWVLSALKAQSQFVLFLEGEVGVGKSALVRELFYLLGVPRREAITSPTFTYINEYQVGTKRFAHLDFYRAGSEMLDIALADIDTYDGVFVEWPGEHPASSVRPTVVVRITLNADDSRTFSLSAV